MTHEGKVVYLPSANLGDQGPKPPLKGGGGDGTFDDMESRLKLLEYRADQTEKLLVRMDGKLDTLLKDVSEIKGKVANVPTVWTIWQTNAALLATVVAVALGTVALLKNFGLL